jgi:hypothetical protein
MDASYHISDAGEVSVILMESPEEFNPETGHESPNPPPYSNFSNGREVQRSQARTPEAYES